MPMTSAPPPKVTRGVRRARGWAPATETPDWRLNAGFGIVRNVNQSSGKSREKDNGTAQTAGLLPSGGRNTTPGHYHGPRLAPFRAARRRAGVSGGARG